MGPRRPAPRSLGTVLGAAILFVAGEASANAPLPAPGVARFHGGVDQASTPTCTSPKLSYFGGPILQSPNIVTVFWNASVNATLKANIAQFYADVTVSSYWPWLHEYDTVGVAGSGAPQAILPGSAAAGVTITPVQCPSSAACNLSDAQLKTEIVRQIGLGTLPAPALDCTGNVDTVYMVHLPPSVTLAGPGIGNSCVKFCAYHNTGTYGSSNLPLVYAALPDLFTTACATGCGSNATALENSTSVASHELAEAVTDPDIGLDTQSGYATPAAWGDNNNSCGEIGDICDDGSPGDTITVSGRTWTVQQLWSNAQARCTSTGTAPPICSGTTVSGCRKCSCGDSGHACSGLAAACETGSTNALFGACEQCTSGNTTACGAAACLQSTTPSQDDVCAATRPAPALGTRTPLLAVALLLGGTLLGSSRRKRA